MVARTPRTEILELQLSPEAMQAITEAASVAGQSVSEFVLASALSRVEETLPGRQHVGPTTEQSADFIAALDAPPKDQPRLRWLLRDPSVVDPDDAE